MKEIQLIMGMPVIVEIKGDSAKKVYFGRVFDWFREVDERFSTFKSESEISRINNGSLKSDEYSEDMELLFKLSEQTKQETQGYFDIVRKDGTYDPSGIVKGWAIFHAAKILEEAGCRNFYVEAGGDIQVQGLNNGKGWSVGIKNPFKPQEIIKSVVLRKNEGIATSGSYERGNHIYNPKDRQDELAEIVSLTVVGPNVYEADRFATAAFAMQKEGIYFIEKLRGFEAYMVDRQGIATMTSNFESYVHA